MILHIISDDKFTSEYIDIVNEYFNAEEHFFLIQSYLETKKFVNSEKWKNTILLRKNPEDSLLLFRYLIRADKVIIHGMFSRIAMILVILAGASKKSYCCLWGGDLYAYLSERRSLTKIKKYIIQRTRGIGMELWEDYQLARKWYGATCPYYANILYMSNVVRKDTPVCHKKTENTFVVQIGNSADPANNHLEVLERIKGYCDKEIRIVLPLSYGIKEYANEVAERYKEIFPDKVQVLWNFMSIEEYTKILESIDVAIFAHRRQQGLGNIISLLAMGKKVYIPEKVSVYQAMVRAGVKVFKTETCSNNLMDDFDAEDRERNAEIIRSYWTKERLIDDWRRIFEA